MVGKFRGSPEGAPPELYSAADLSWVEDALKALEAVDPMVMRAAWSALPDRLKLEYNYSRRQYVPVDQRPTPK